MKAFIDKYNSWIVCFLLVVTTSIVFGQMINHNFVYFDDHRYVADNSVVKAGLSVEGIKWAFSTTTAEFWHPLTWISLMLDSQIFGVIPGGYLFSNLLLHVLNTLLLFLFLNRATGAVWRSGFVAALFALHPLHVESVAWIAQRKDVLSTLFWMLTLISYAVYVERPGFKTYLAVLMALILGLLAKPMLVTLPFVLLLLDYWPLNRFKDTSSFKALCISTLSLAKEKIPMFAAIIAASFITILSQSGEGRIKSLAVLALETRLANVLISYVKYLAKIVWPHNLACFYPFPETFPWWQVGGAFLILALVTALAVRFFRQYPFLIVGWLWYLGTLVPVIGFIKIGAFAMADRYSYVPLVGIFIMLAWGGPELLATRRYGNKAAAYLAGAVVVMCLSMTWFQVRVWQDRKALFTHALKVTSGNYLAHTQLGMDLREEQQFDKAIWHFSEALRIRPTYIPTYINLGYTYAIQKKYSRAIAYYSEAVQKQPYHPEPHQALGVLFEQQGELDKALAHLETALEIKPENAVAHKHLGNVFLSQGKLQKAIGHYSESLRIEPGDAEVHYNLGVAFEEQGKMEKAVEQYSLALAANPENADAHYNLANLLARQKKYDRAVAHYRKALAVQPDSIQILNNLAFVYASMQKYDEAISTLQRLAELQPQEPRISYLLSGLFAKQNQLPESIKWLEKAFKQGFRNCSMIKADRDLDNIKSLENFDDLMRHYCTD